MKIFFTCFLICFITATFAQSEEANKSTDVNIEVSKEQAPVEDKKPAEARPASGLHFSVGGGYALKSNIRKDNLYRDTNKNITGKAIPMAQVFIGPVQIGAGGLTINVLGNPFLGAYLNLSQLGDNYYGSNMEKRKESWGAGIGAKVFGFQFQLNRDINGRSKGVKGEIGYGKPQIINEKILIRYGIKLEYLNQKYMDYYYGVRSTEASAARPFYSPNSAMNIALNAFPIYKFDEKINMMAGYSIKFLNKKIQDSPTTNGKKVEHALIFGATYVLY